MAGYDPHKRVSITDEEEVMSKGRLVKARFPDQPPPNVDWFWIPTGNCHACKHYGAKNDRPVCLDPKISDDDFFHKWGFTNTCPEFAAGISAQRMPGNEDSLDLMKAVGLIPGAPKQQVAVIRDEPWSIDLALRAHREQSEFLDMARDADYFAAHPGSNDPSHWDYVDLSDDLERPDPPPVTAEEEDAQNAAIDDARGA